MTHLAFDANPIETDLSGIALCVDAVPFFRPTILRHEILDGSLSIPLHSHSIRSYDQSANGHEKHLVHMLKYYHPDPDRYDDQMKQLLQMGLHEQHMWERFV